MQSSLGKMKVCLNNIYILNCIISLLLFCNSFEKISYVYKARGDVFMKARYP